MSSDRHLWEIRWVRDLFVLLVLALVSWVIYEVRAITAPVLIGLGLAYITNPLVEWAQRRHKAPRWLSTLLILLGLLVVFLAAMVFLTPRIARQSAQLARKLRDYAQWLIEQAQPYLHRVVNDAQQLASTTESAAEGGPATRPAFNYQDLSHIDLEAVRGVLLKAMDLGVGALGALGSFIGLMTYLGLAAVIIAFCFVAFSARLDRIKDWAVPLIPLSKRQRTLEVLGMMNRSIEAFIRGRLIQSLVMATVLSIGWSVVGLPYWLLLGILCGLLNLIPYAAVAGWLLAMGLGAVDGLTIGAFSWQILLWTSVVYFGAQLLDGWVIEPLVQGKATNLDPLSVLLAVLIGGTLAGLLGMLLAIPIAACLKILAQEVILPKWRDMAANKL